MKRIILIALLLGPSWQIVQSQVLISLFSDDKLTSDKLNSGLAGGANLSNITNIVLMGSAFPQDSITKKEIRKQKNNFLQANKTWTVELPVWLPGFVGSFVYGDIEIEGEDGVDPDPDPEHPIEPPPGWDTGKILSRIFTAKWYLKFFIFTKLVYEKNRFMSQLDGFSGALGRSVKFNYNDTEIVQLNFRSTNIRLFGGYKIVQAKSKNKKFHYKLFGYLGVRMNFEEIYSDLNGVINKLNINPFWIEPIIGMQNHFVFKRWLIVLQGDYGGYFVKSKSSIQLSSFLHYRTGKITSFKIGWNHFYINHKGSLLNKDYKIITTFSGPTIGIAFHF